jgi:hypothetical protein
MNPCEHTPRLPSTLALRNAIALDQADITRASEVSDLGSSTAAFAELVAVMRTTGNLLDADVLHALIARLAELLSEPLPSDL